MNVGASFAAGLAKLAGRVGDLERLVARGAQAGDYVPELVGAAIGIGGGPLNVAEFDLSGGNLIVDGNIVFGEVGVIYPQTVTTASLPPGLVFASILDPATRIGECEMNIAGTNYPGAVWAWSPTAVRFVTQDVSGSRVRTVAPGASSPAAWSSPAAIRYHYTARVRRTT